MLSSARTQPIESVERFFQFSLLGLDRRAPTSPWPRPGFLDRPTLILTFVGLLLRAATVAGLLGLRDSGEHRVRGGPGDTSFSSPTTSTSSRAIILPTTVHGVCFLATVKILTRAQSNRDYVWTDSVISFVELISRGAALHPLPELLRIPRGLHGLRHRHVHQRRNSSRAPENRNANWPLRPVPAWSWRLAVVAVTCNLRNPDHHPGPVPYRSPHRTHGGDALPQHAAPYRILQTSSTWEVTERRRLGTNAPKSCTSFPTRARCTPDPQVAWHGAACRPLRRQTMESNRAAR